MRRMLSARTTSLFHAIPALWLLAVGACMWMLRGEPSTMPLFVLMAALPAMVLWGMLHTLRFVSTDGERLYVASWTREIAISFSQIAVVRQVGGGRRGQPTVVLTLHDRTPLGQEIRFMPRTRWMPDPGALQRAQALQATDPEAASMALLGGLSAAEEIRQRVEAASRANHPIPQRSA